MTNRRNILILGLIILILVAASIFFKIIRTNNQQTAQSQPKQMTEKHQKSWGVYTGNTAASFSSFEQEIGKQANMNAVFVGFGDSFPSGVAESLKNNGQTIVIFWEPNNTTLDQIIAGSSDSYISSFATDMRAYGGPVILVPMEEMNGNWDTWDRIVGDNTPAKFISAFQHIHNLFSGVTNVRWGWAVNSDSTPDIPENAISNYYPGSNYVDYVGVDGFNFGNPWQSYSDIFSSALKQLATYNKPIYIFSMACAEGPQKAVWITDALSNIYSNPNIVGWIWFNENKEKNWLVTSNPASLQAFKAGIQ